MSQKFLSDILGLLDKQKDVLSQARDKHLAKEAERKHFEAVLIKTALGKSHAEKVINAQAEADWLTFHKELARLEAIFEFHKLKFEVLDKEFQARYLEAKLDQGMIKKQGV